MLAALPIESGRLRYQCNSLTKRFQLESQSCSMPQSFWLRPIYLKPVLDNSSEISYCKINFCNVCVELCRISIKVEITLKQKITKLVRLSTAKDIGDVDFSSSGISIRTRGLISIKSVCKLTKYVSQLLISIITLIRF